MRCRPPPNNLPEVCGRICPQDRLCEQACVLEQSEHGSVTIGAIEKYITDTAWELGWVKPVTPDRERTESVGIIGGGPGGMAAAEELRKLGYQVDVYDRYDRIGGLLVYGIPNFKLDKAVVARRVDLLKQAGVRFHYNVDVGNTVGFAALRQKHSALLIATGVYQARALTCPGVGATGVFRAMTYLTASNRHGLGDAVPAFTNGSLDAAGKNVVVIGGGDTAMDCVRTAVRQGAKSVKCLYRRDRENMPGSQREVGNAIEEGVEFVWQSAPEAILHDGDNKVTGVRAMRTRLAMPDASGRAKPEDIAGSQFVIPADMVIEALGFDPEEVPKLFGAPELGVTRWGTIKADPDTKMTSLDGVFAAGDIVRGCVPGGVGDPRWPRRHGRHPRLYPGPSENRANRAQEGIVTMSGHMKKESGEEFVAAYQANVAKLTAAHAYDPADEHDACGVGMVVAIDGKPRREVVQAGIDALKVLFHRGAVDADGKTGDGAGIHVQIPQDFFRDHVNRSGHTVADTETLCVGMVFLPKTDLAAQETCRTIVEGEMLNAGYYIFGWRQVPVDISVIGEKANATRPEIEQIMIANRRGLTGDALERDLYLVRRRIEKRVLDEHINDFYICSLSSRSLIYKGMFLAEQLSTFYPDLMDARFVSAFAIYHQRYSTNTFPTWRLAQPFRTLAHNGEINTLLGNINWMKAHECRLDHPAFGESIEDLKPVIQPSGSDSAALDNVFELLCRAGRDAPAARCLVVPESISQNAVMPEAHRDMFSYCKRGHGALGRTGGLVRHGWPLAGRLYGSQRSASHALLAHPRWIADRRFRDRDGAHPKRRRAGEGPRRSRADDCRRPQGRPLLPRHGDQGTSWPRASPMARGSRTRPTWVRSSPRVSRARRRSRRKS